LLRDQLPCNFVFAGANFRSRPVGNQSALIEDCDPISHAFSAMSVVRNDDQRGLMLGLLLQHQLIDLTCGYTIKSAARFIC